MSKDQAIGRDLRMKDLFVLTPDQSLFVLLIQSKSQDVFLPK